MQTTPQLGHFYEDAMTELNTDASNVGLGAVLVQWQGGVERVMPTQVALFHGRRATAQIQKRVLGCYLGGHKVHALLVWSPISHCERPPLLVLACMSQIPFRTPCAVEPHASGV